MNYCLTCKRLAKDTDTVCGKCGGSLSRFGAAPTQSGQPGAGTGPGAKHGGSPGFSPASAPTLSLQGEVQKLQEVQLQNTKRSLRLGLICALVLIALMFTLYEIYAQTVLAYAVLDKVTIEQDPRAEQMIRVSFDVVTPGKVAFDRRSGGNHTEKLDVLTKTGANHQEWAWPSDPKTGIDFSVLYRGGLLRTSIDKHFAVTHEGGAAGVDIVFLMDITSSMAPFIEVLKQSCNEFADRVRNDGADCQLGLVGFGDVEINEPIYVYKTTQDINQFKDHVSSLRVTGGGDPPESDVEALQRALQLKFRRGARVCFVLITDAPCHHPQELAGLADELRERDIITYVVSRQELRELYEPLCVNGGQFRSIQGARFEDILLNLAQSIANQIRSQ
jgi:Mg-chelatase subunit ChlD